MFKKVCIVLVVISVLITAVPVMAKGQPQVDVSTVVTYPVIFEESITVTSEGGKFEVGFVTFQFLKNCLPEGELPITFDVKIYAKDGEAGIEISPSVERFTKPVLIKVDRYNQYLFDENAGENVIVNVKKQVVVAKHFSWYRFR
ncbi:UNVERIFIED_CONTAM: hypothetical protein Cloal_3224 [Acetivibrio alkalicellulosi]